MAVLMFVAVFPVAGSGPDDSDPIKGASGIRPVTDHLTGCQYLTRGFGGLTPRMNAEGKQVCRDDLKNK